MTKKELSQLKEDDVIYEYDFFYTVIKTYKSGVLTRYKWKNQYGTFSDDKFFKNKELLHDNFIVL